MKYHRKKEGSVLIVTLILGTAIALALGSYLAVTLNAVRLSHRSYTANSSLNLSEAGLEEAIYALNNNKWDDWKTHSSGTENKFLEIDSIDLGQGATGKVAVLVYGINSTNPKIVSQGGTTSTSGAPITKQIECIVRRSSDFSGAVAAKEKVTASGGNVKVDSYRSCDPAYSTGGLYDPAKRNDRGSVASARVETEIGVDIGNANVFGYIATAGADVDVGPTGSVRGNDTPSGVRIDPDRITKDFSANFEPKEQPDTTGTLDLALGLVIVGSSDPENPLRKTVPSLDIKSTETLLIQGHVELIVETTVTVKGGIEILSDTTVSPAVTSSVKMFVDGDVDVGGNGIVNQSKIPGDFKIYGTNTTPGDQQIKLSGNGALYAAVFAPNAAIELKGAGGSGEMWGSVVGHTVKLTGNYEVHYDECLDKDNDGNPFTVSSWRELDSAGERYALY